MNIIRCDRCAKELDVFASKPDGMIVLRASLHWGVQILGQWDLCGDCGPTVKDALEHALKRLDLKMVEAGGPYR